MGAITAVHRKLCNRSNFTHRGISHALVTQWKGFIFVALLSINAISVYSPKGLCLGVVSHLARASLESEEQGGRGSLLLT